MKSKELGTLGEKIALNYLKKRGFKILDQNYSLRFISGPLPGEIDIVAQQKDTIHFIEVKTLSQNRAFLNSAISPEEKVNYFKQKKLIKMAESWLMKRKIPLNSKWQIDVISIMIDLNNKKAKMRYFPNISL